VLDAAEVDSSIAVCAGAPGGDGQDGNNGKDGERGEAGAEGPARPIGLRGQKGEGCTMTSTAGSGSPVALIGLTLLLLVWRRRATAL